jgi:hypothetical protein
MSRMSAWGVFPFGKINSERPARRAAKADAVVIGVYPSAWHVRWTAPERHSAGPNGGVQALAVDVEPTVFWDGAKDDFVARLSRWKEDIGFRDGEHGSVSHVSPSTNGSSGVKVLKHYLAPLGLEPERVTFTDIYPVFMIKTGSTKKRGQADAIRQEYDPLATAMGFAPCTLPARIAERDLPRLAAEHFGERLMSDLAEANPPLVITLGREVWETLERLPAVRAQTPATSFDALRSGYGTVGSLFINARRVDWLPLVHPGLLGTASAWETLHASWAVSPKTQL